MMAMSWILPLFHSETTEFTSVISLVCLMLNHIYAFLVMFYFLLLYMSKKNKQQNTRNSRPEKNDSEICNDLKIVAVVNHNSSLCGFDYRYSTVLVSRKKECRQLSISCLLQGREQCWRWSEQLLEQAVKRGSTYRVRREGIQFQCRCRLLKRAWVLLLPMTWSQNVTGGTVLKLYFGNPLLIYYWKIPPLKNTWFSDVLGDFAIFNLKSFLYFCICAEAK